MLPSVVKQGDFNSNKPGRKRVATPFRRICGRLHCIVRKSRHSLTELQCRNRTLWKLHERFCFCFLSLTAVHASRFEDHVIIGRDETAAPSRLVPSKRSPRDPAVGETWRVTGSVQLHPEYGPQLNAKGALP
ncbi:hypothetical protein EV130_1317 [Rhizobium azibense]|uniref:Uncharacterized protein n=1 Tax=Rhizobium azibense TaxID=1136135 RepID=A0A4R3PZN8_9HYPH|nr:hypothetical protein EV130_1317 [Rhizobium azibense]